MELEEWTELVLESDSCSAELCLLLLGHFQSPLCILSTSLLMHNSSSSVKAFSTSISSS